MADPVTPAPVDPLLGPEPELPEPEPEPTLEPTPEPAPEPAPEAPAEPQEPAEPEEPAAEPERSMEPAPGAPKKPGPWSRLRQLEDERNQWKQQFETMQQEIERLKSPPKPAAEQPKPVTYEEDPLEYLRQQQAQIAQAALYSQQQAQIVMMQNQIRAQEEEFSREKADYRDALRFLEDREMKRALVLTGNEQKAREFVNARAALLVQTAQQTGKTVPSLAYEIALAEGWATPVASPKETTPAVTPQQRVKDSKARTAIESTSVGRVPGGAPPHSPVRSRQQLLEMSAAEMDRLDREDPGWEQRLEA